MKPNYEPKGAGFLVFMIKPHLQRKFILFIWNTRNPLTIEGLYRKIQLSW